MLTVVKSTFSSNNFAVYIGPDQETRGLDARVPTRVKVVKDGSTHRQMHKDNEDAFGIHRKVESFLSTEWELVSAAGKCGRGRLL